MLLFIHSATCWLSRCIATMKQTKTNSTTILWCVMWKMIDDVLVENGKTLRIASFSIFGAKLIFIFIFFLFFLEQTQLILMIKFPLADSSKGSNKPNWMLGKKITELYTNPDFDVCILMHSPQSDWPRGNQENCVYTNQCFFFSSLNSSLGSSCVVLLCQNASNTKITKLIYCSAFILSYAGKNLILCDHFKRLK